MESIEVTSQAPWNVAIHINVTDAFGELVVEPTTVTLIAAPQSQSSSGGGHSFTFGGILASSSGKMCFGSLCNSTSTASSSVVVFSAPPNSSYTLIAMATVSKTMDSGSVVATQLNTSESKLLVSACGAGQVIMPLRCEDCGPEGTENFWECECLRGFFFYERDFDSVGNPAACLDCPPGGSCTKKGLKDSEVQPDVGFWLSIWPPNELKFLTCRNNACQGVRGECAEGYKGVLCSVCEDGWSRSGQSDCVKCQGGTEAQVTLLRNIWKIQKHGDLIVSALCMHCQEEMDGVREKSSLDRTSTLVKITIFAVQFNSLAADFEYEWPGFVRVPIMIPFLSIITVAIFAFKYYMARQEEREIVTESLHKIKIQRMQNEKWNGERGNAKEEDNQRIDEGICGVESEGEAASTPRGGGRKMEDTEENLKGSKSPTKSGHRAILQGDAYKDRSDDAKRGGGSRSEDDND
eukprot:jgi/Bigna1/143429/aug1.78_g18137